MSGGEDVKRTRRRWTAREHSGHQQVEALDLLRVDDGRGPAQGQSRASRRLASVGAPRMKSRLTELEVVAILEAARGRRERRAIFLAACAGLRNAEREVSKDDTSHGWSVWVAAT